MHPLVGYRLGGAHITARDLAPATLGEPVWGPSGLAADLALRLSAPTRREDPMARLAAASEALASLAARDPTAFFAKSHAVDPWGTTRVVLALRDALVDAGWDAAPPARGRGRGARATTTASTAVIGDASPRVALLARLTDLPEGDADRLAALERRLATARTRPYERLTLAEPIDSGRWSRRWRLVFERLAGLGVKLDALPAAAPAAPADTDLGRAQRALAGQGGDLAPRGDGTLVLLSGGTPEPLAEAVASWLARPVDGTRAVLRTAAVAPLEAALAAHGLPRLGGLRATGPAAAAAWLPLVLQLAKPPFDPEAAVDLLLLPDHPLHPRAQRELARVLSDRPGLGGAFAARVAAVRPDDPEGVDQILRWLTPIAADVANAAPAAELAARLEALDKVLRRRLGRAVGTRAERAESAAAAAALALASADVAAVLRLLPRDGGPVAASLDAVLRTFAERAAAVITRREAGAPPVADAPDALVAEVDDLLWWGFVEPPQPPGSPWRAAEREGLARHGVGLPHPAAALRAEAAAARAAFLRARRAVVLVHPERLGGERQPVHPLWSELAGRLGLTDDKRAAKVRRTPSTWAAAGPVAPVAPAPLPPASASWQVAPGTIDLAGLHHIGATALANVTACPLRGALESHARLRREPTGAIAGGPPLLGKVGHRVVERLVDRGALGRASSDEVADHLRLVLADEAAHLLREGRASERRQLARTLVRAAQRLAAELAERGLTAVAAEEPGELFDPALGGVRIHYQTDLRCRTADGRDVVVDLKWSSRACRELLARDAAVQLAIYVRGIVTKSAAPGSANMTNDGHYFGLMRGDWVAPPRDGALAETWRRLVRTVAAVQEGFRGGRVPVPPLLDGDVRGGLFGLTAADRLDHDDDTACRYCPLGAVCGRSWRSLAGLDLARAGGAA